MDKNLIYNFINMLTQNYYSSKCNKEIKDRVN